MRHSRMILCAVVCLVLGVGAAAVTAQGPQPQSPAGPAVAFERLTYQGRLSTSAGAPVGSPVTMTFRLYDDDSVLVWTSATRVVTPSNGLFTVYLGDPPDPALIGFVLAQAASLGVTVGGDTEMTPRQSLNAIVGHSVNAAGVVGMGDIGVLGQSQSGIGVHGESVLGEGVEGFSETGVGVYAFTHVITQPALIASVIFGGTAIRVGGGIQVPGSGIASQTPAFIHQVHTSGPSANVCMVKNYASVVDNRLINGKPGAILVVTPNYGPVSSGVSPQHGSFGVFYDDNNTCQLGAGRWVIYITDASPGALNDSNAFNVWAVYP